MFQDQDYNGNYNQLQVNKQSIIHLRNYKLWLTSLKTKFKINLVYSIQYHYNWTNSGSVILICTFPSAGYNF